MFDLENFQILHNGTIDLTDSRNFMWHLYNCSLCYSSSGIHFYSNLCSVLNNIDHFSFYSVLVLSSFIHFRSYSVPIQPFIFYNHFSLYPVLDLDKANS